MTSETGVFQVGDGRGFHVGDFILTAAHCLPHLPPPMTMTYTEERTYPKLIAPLGLEPTVWAEVAFVDPVSDLAVLCEPDNQQLPDQWRAYHELLAAADSFTIADVEADKEIAAKVLSLDSNGWVTGVAQVVGDGQLLLKEPMTTGGMSGSPVLDDKGNAIGVVTTGVAGGSGWAINCRLMRSLPRWFPL